MKAVIPCAKKEDNLFPFIESRPTGLMPVAGKPVVSHLIDSLKDAEIDQIYLVTNYRQEMYEEEFEGYTDVNVVEQEELNGTGGAVETCDFIDEDFLVVNGDVVVSGRDIRSLVKKHKQKRPEASILATDEKKAEKFGVLSIENDKVVELVEKPEEPQNTLINTGIYVFRPEIFDSLKKLDDDDKKLTEAVREFLEDGTRFELVKDYWIDIGSPEKLLKADQVKLSAEAESKIAETAEVHESAVTEGRVKVESEAEIGPGTVIEGPALIGENSKLGPNSTVKNSTVNSGCVIRSADIEDSVVFSETTIAPSVHIGFSVLAEECTIKSGTAVTESFIGPRSFIEMNNSVKGVKFVPDARTDLSEISK